MSNSLVHFKTAGALTIWQPKQCVQCTQTVWITVSPDGPQVPYCPVTRRFHEVDASVCDQFRERPATAEILGRKPEVFDPPAKPFHVRMASVGRDSHGLAVFVIQAVLAAHAVSILVRTLLPHS